ncbi:MAG: HPr-rel-A system PqqD family peptide chaperone [Gammaproteobacteria bacterium]|jgi:PqqD family protein of HPr-rel-A system|nr:HPr-rel-A system PqqD family peptide chaperone [Gammaproteobacteria bacterium]
MRWRVSTAGKFYDENEGSVVYFDPASGDTHLLTDFAAQIVRELSGAAKTSRELEDSLADMTDTADQAQLREAIATVIGELVELGVVHLAVHDGQVVDSAPA